MTRLRHRMTIQAVTSADGAELVTYGNWRSDLPCNIVPGTGGETVRGFQLEADIDYIIETRYIPGILPTMQIIDPDDKTLNISRVRKIDGRNRRLLITATEAVA